MTAVQDGQLIEGVLYLLDNNPIINPTFNAPASSITHLAGSLGFNPSLINPRQICQAISPLAETLFPSPRVPVFRTHLKEGWIVFEEPSVRPILPLELRKKRTGLTSYSNGNGLDIIIPSGWEGSMSSASLRQTPSGELGDGLPHNGESKSAVGTGTGRGKGKKSFLRPFLLGGRKKKAVEIPKREEQELFDLINTPQDEKEEGYEGIVDDYLGIEVGPESPYEETAFVSDGKHDEVQASPVWAPLTGKGKVNGASKRVVELRVEPGSKVIPPVVISPITSRSLIPSTTATPRVFDSPVTSPVLSPTSSVLTPTTAIPLASVEVQSPLTPIPTTPTTPSLSITVSSSPASDTTTVPSTPRVTPSEPSSNRASHGDNNHYRNREKTSEERQGRKEREHNRHEEGKRSDGERRSRSNRSTKNEKDEKEDTWLEGVFEDLPFGPDKNMSRALESIKKDYKIFIAEIIALAGLAYVIQRSGW